ncbi:hypothetical protein MMC07_000890 [Pseudocyphellaria aurata]|nr:hypothetical protein [Pseudocyphellaria aurata]
MEGLVDLSLFATSPNDGRHLARPDDLLTYREVPVYRSHRERSHPLPRSFAMKPLPPLPPRRMCTRRPVRGRHDVNSRCILMRMKRAKRDERTGNENPTIQERRNLTTPQLTLSVPPPAAREESSARADRVERGPRSSMIWMPEEQMWLIQDNVDSNAPPYYWDYTAPPGQPERRYARSEPSPDFNAHFDVSPDSPVRSQFLSLMESSSRPRLSDRERLNPLFQEAVQTVPLTDLSPLSPLSREPSSVMDHDWLSNSSEYQSYHTASNSLTVEEPQIVFPQLAWVDAWEGERRRVVDEPQIVFPQLAWGSSWEGVARRVTRPASAMS